MKKVLGLDLGSASIGWAIIEIDDNGKKSINSLGSRIVPVSVDDADEFSKGKDMSKNKQRTERRTARKGQDRYQLRRGLLIDFLVKKGMHPLDEQKELQKLELWGIRAKAVKELISLPELGRVLLHINQKRGYQGVREDGDDKSARDYVKLVMGRYADIVSRNQTIGEHFYNELCSDSFYRVKDQVYPRRAYVEEFDKIISCQRQFYPDILTDEVVDELRNRIIFYQRGLKSCKHLVSICDFEKRPYENKRKGDGSIVWRGPKVAPKSSPISQVCKIWESVNNVVLKNRRGEELMITPLQRRAMFDFLNENDSLKLTNLYKILGITKSDGWWAGKSVGKGIQGNVTRGLISKALGDEYQDLLKFDIQIEDSNCFDLETGVVIQQVSSSFEEEPLYRLWHLLYSVKDSEELKVSLRKQFSIEKEEVLESLCKIDFVKFGYTNKSAKSMRRILPYLSVGLKYSEACEAAGFRHSESLTLEELAKRPLAAKLKNLEKNELRQPVVEKILNQMIGVVNALMERHGYFDEIRIELARELKMSKDERGKATEAISKAESANKRYAKEIETYGLTPTRSRIQKFRMWEESDKKCFYCGQPVGAAEFLRGFDVEVEHILPKSLYFDDSFSNKVCSCRGCNSEKNNRTAFDFMKSKSDKEFQDYISLIEDLYKRGKISKTKYERLLTPKESIPTDFISRQLRESQYIARKAHEILTAVCRNVTATSGSVTAYLRHIWGWGDVLHSLNIDRYRLAGLVESVEREHRGKCWSEDVVKGWSKREDHRHHAIDALVIASTKQSYIQRMNNMSSSDNPELKEDQEISLKRYIASEQPFTTSEVLSFVSRILISYKAGKRSATLGKRYIHRKGKRVLVQERVVIPRGALHEESVYGQIQQYERDKLGRSKVEYKSVKRYTLESLKKKNIEDIVDRGMRRLVQERFDNFIGDEKSIWKDLKTNPLMFNGRAVKSVRCFTGLSSKSIAEVDRGFMKLGNNHHVALYEDENGDVVECCVTFWHAVERKKYNIPIVIKDPESVYDTISFEGVSEEFMTQLPHPKWKFIVSFQQNDMFIMGMERAAFEEAFRDKDYALLGEYLYKVQNVATKDYRLCLHNVTKFDMSLANKPDKRFLRISSFKAFFNYEPQKVKISLTGELIKV